MNGNNEFYQNSMINARKDNDEWKNAAGTCSPNLIEKSVTENGDYSAKADGADGYSSVTVEVPSAPTPETFEVTIREDISEDGNNNSSITISCNAQYSDIYNALQSNKEIIGTLILAGGGLSISTEIIGVKTSVITDIQGNETNGILFAFQPLVVGNSFWLYMFMAHDEGSGNDYWAINPNINYELDTWVVNNVINQ